MKPEDIILQKVRQPLHSRPLADIPGEVRRQLEPLRATVRPGMRIAIGVGSRGVNNMATIVRTMADTLKAWGAAPFLVPAMGSHGGATAQGQAEVLAGYGVTAESMGVPVLSSMQTVRIGTADVPEATPVYMDQNAWEADGVLVVNRVKAHTDFHGEHESGIVKMLVIGLGKQAQANAVHAHGIHGLRNLVPPAARVVLQSGKILGALGIVEDGHDNTSQLAFALPQQLFEVDRQLLARSKEWMAKLPFDEVDVLVIDEMGKDVSGSGMDTNIIGRLRILGHPDSRPFCHRIVTLDLTPASHGNALGVGLADVISRRLADKIDWDATITNVATSGFLERGFCPVVCENDRAAIAMALRTCTAPNPGSPRIARIKNTLLLDEFYITDTLAFAGMEPVGAPAPMQFDAAGQLAAF